MSVESIFKDLTISNGAKIKDTTNFEINSILKDICGPKRLINYKTTYDNQNWVLLDFKTFVKSQKITSIQILEAGCLELLCKGEDPIERDVRLLSHKKDLQIVRYIVEKYKLDKRDFSPSAIKSVVNCGNFYIWKYLIRELKLSKDDIERNDANCLEFFHLDYRLFMLYFTMKNVKISPEILEKILEKAREQDQTEVIFYLEKKLSIVK